MSPAPESPVALSFGQAYERLQEVATELSADAAMPPERLIALLREGKGLERALRDHLDRVEQEVRAIDEGDGATPFRIVDGTEAVARPAAPVAEPADGAPEAPTAAPAPVRDAPPSADGTAPGSSRPAPDPAPPAAPTLGFPGADDDIPF